MSAMPDRSEPITSTSRAAPFDAAHVFRWVAGVTAVLVLIQAALAGRGWFLNDPDLIDLHGWVGNATFVAAIALAALAYAAHARGALGRLELGLSALLVVLVVAQLGLGYGGRENGDAAAWHIPTGVLIFGVTAALLGLSVPRRD